MEQGAPLRAEVAEVNPDDAIWNRERLKIRVGLGGMGLINGVR